jgi:hypothetical protein
MSKFFRKAQSTSEFLIVLSVVLLTFLVIFKIYSERIESVRISQTLMSAKDISSKVGRTINQVYKAGNSSFQVVDLEPTLANHEEYNLSIKYRRVEVSWEGKTYDYPILVERAYLVGGNVFNVSNRTLMYKDVTALAIGDGENSGLNSFYAGVKNSEILNEILSNSTFVPLGFCGKKIYAICVADADPDLAGNEIYVGQTKVGSPSQNFYQFHWNGTTFEMVEIDVGYSIVAIACGDGNHSGTDEIYFAVTNDPNVYEFKKVGASWVTTSMGGNGQKVYSLAVGDGDNDGFDEVYAGDKNGHIYKYEYISGAYQITDLAEPAVDVIALAVGDGDNDGDHETYFALDNDANLYELLDDGGVINHGGLGFKAVSIVVGNPFNDPIGDNSVYLGDKVYNVYKYATPYFDVSGRTLLVYNDEGVIKIAFS